LSNDEIAAGADSGNCVTNLAAHTRDEHVVVMTEIDDVARNSETGDKDASSVVNDGLNLRRHISGRRSKEVDAEWFVSCGANLLHLFNHAGEIHC